MSHTLEGMKFLNLGLLHRSVAMADSNIHTILEYTTMNTTYGDTTSVVTIVERCDKHLRSTLKLLRGRDNLNYLVEKIVDIVSRLIPLLSHPAIFS